MSRFYVSFGKTHTHKLGDEVIDHNCIVEIITNSELLARRAASKVFNNKFSILYSQKPNMKSFPRGIFDLDGNSLKIDQGYYSLSQFI
jgi:hypothetical protein